MRDVMWPKSHEYPLPARADDLVDSIPKLLEDNPDNICLNTFDKSYYDSLETDALKGAFLKCLMSGIENPDSGVGCYACHVRATTIAITLVRDMAALGYLAPSPPRAPAVTAAVPAQNYLGCARVRVLSRTSRRTTTVSSRSSRRCWPNTTRSRRTRNTSTTGPLKA